jgi:hypothetical protein
MNAYNSHKCVCRFPRLKDLHCGFRKQDICIARHLTEHLRSAGDIAMHFSRSGANVPVASISIFTNVISANHDAILPVSFADEIRRWKSLSQAFMAPKKGPPPHPLHRESSTHSQRLVLRSHVPADLIQESSLSRSGFPSLCTLRAPRGPRETDVLYRYFAVPFADWFLTALKHLH